MFGKASRIPSLVIFKLLFNKATGLMFLVSPNSKSSLSKYDNHNDTKKSSGRSSSNSGGNSSYEKNNNRRDGTGVGFVDGMGGSVSGDHQTTGKPGGDG